MVERLNFGKLKAVIDPPDMIDIQTKSYLDFLQMDVRATARKKQGLQAVFKEACIVIIVSINLQGIMIRLIKPEKMRLSV